MGVLDNIAQCVWTMDKAHIEGYLDQALQDPSLTVEQIYIQGLNRGMTRALQMYEAKEYYLPEVIVCADTLNLGLSRLRSQVSFNMDSGVRVTMAVAEGDTHEIGKNIVKVMLEASGFAVQDLGVNQCAHHIVEAAIGNHAQVVALSSMMTSTMGHMREVVEELKQLERDEPGFKRPFVLVGGAPVTEAFAQRIGADAYAADAPEVVRILQKHFGGADPAAAATADCGGHE